jgi:uncharacterized protein with PIN domain
MINIYLTTSEVALVKEALEAQRDEYISTSMPLESPIGMEQQARLNKINRLLKQLLEKEQE